LTHKASVATIHRPWFRKGRRMEGEARRQPGAAARETPSASGKFAAGTGLLACAVLALVAGGCGSEKLLKIEDLADFQQTVLKAKRPVVVDFHKGGGCPPCKMLEPVLAQLCDEYQGRVIFARFELISAFFEVTSEELKAKYDIFYIPTAILFVNGKEVKRWPLDFMINDYRKVLDQYVGPPAPPGPMTGRPYEKAGTAPPPKPGGSAATADRS